MASMRKGSTYQVGKLAIEEIMQEGDQAHRTVPSQGYAEFCRGDALPASGRDETRCLDYLMYMKRFTRMIDEGRICLYLLLPVHDARIRRDKVLLDHYYGYRCMIHRPEASIV